MIDNFDELLKRSTEVHGHICPGQVLGVRLSILGLHKIGIKDPLGKDRKNLYVIVEIDRCATDAIQSVTGCSLGKRSLKWLDFGVMAATFVNLNTNRAVRVTAREEARETAKQYCPEIEDKYKQQLEAYRVMPDDVLFKVEEVEITIPEHDLPGRPQKRVQCRECGDWVQDGRDIDKNGDTLCKQCAYGRYYKVTTS